MINQSLQHLYKLIATIFNLMAIINILLGTAKFTYERIIFMTMIWMSFFCTSEIFAWFTSVNLVSDYQFKINSFKDLNKSSLHIGTHMNTFYLINSTKAQEIIAMVARKYKIYQSPELCLKDLIKEKNVACFLKQTFVDLMDLSSFIAKTQCECLNESDDHPLVQCLSADDGFLESDCDEQLIISFTFLQAVKVHSIKIKAPAEKGPKNLKLFINQPRTIDFDMADSNTSTQDITFSTKDLEEGNPVPLRYVKFQNVQNLQIFVKDNQSGAETTQIDHLVIIGTPISTTNMGEFKRVAGKKGESH